MSLFAILSILLLVFILSDCIPQSKEYNTNTPPSIVPKRAGNGFYVNPNPPTVPRPLPPKGQR